MSPVARWKDDPKNAAIIKRIEAYCILFFRIVLVLMAWLIWELLTQTQMYRRPPLRGWIVPVVSATLFCLCYLVLRKLVKGFRPAYRFRHLGPADLWIALAWVVFAGFRFFFLVAYEQIFNIPERHDEQMEAYLRLPYGWIAILLLTFIFAPIIEELTFRGLIQRALERRFTPLVAIMGAAAVFALVHGDGEMIVPHFLGGLVYGYAVFATRTVWAGVIMHAGHNVLTVALGQWIGGSDELAKHINIFITTIITAILLMMLLWLGFKIWRARRPLHRTEAQT